MACPYNFIDFTDPNTNLKQECSLCEGLGFDPALFKNEKSKLNENMFCVLSGDFIYQIVDCMYSQCIGRFVLKCHKNDPVLDLEDRIMMPHIDPFLNIQEQMDLCSKSDSEEDPFKFKQIKAWDIDHLTDQDILESERYSPDKYLVDGNAFYTENALFINSEKELLKIIDREWDESDHYLLKRFYPNRFPFDALMQFVAPQQITSIEVLAYPPTPDTQIQEKYDALLKLIKFYCDDDPFQYVEKKLREHNLYPDGGDAVVEIQNMIKQRINSACNSSNAHDVYMALLGFQTTPKPAFERISQNICYPVCTELFLREKRAELSSWVEMAAKGRALFIDAPMGLGKTYSIIDGLASNPELSAVIFMPTRRLCEEIQNKLVRSIKAFNSRTSGKKELFADQSGIIPLEELDFELEFDEDGELIDRYYPEYIKQQGVYFFDGITKDECEYYDQIIELYDKHIFSKKSKCNACHEQEDCRFLKHWEEAQKYRIIIATHTMYDQIFNKHESLKWDKDGELRERDFFIVDEDIVFSKCYQPISMTTNEFRTFVATVRNFLADEDYFKASPIANEIFYKIDSAFSQYMTCDATSYIPPIDTNFSFSEAVKKQWSKSEDERIETIPDTIEPTFIIGNYLELLENCIRKGFIVQQYPSNTGLVKRAFFPNPKTYQFTDKTPAHVFFDGTMFDDEILKKKLLDCDFKSLKIKIDEPLWEIQSWQNVNTDLPKNKFESYKESLKSFLLELFQEFGTHNRYFIITTKAIRYHLEEWLHTEASSMLNDPGNVSQTIIEHYGNLRGLNRAKHCNIGIILGSYLLSDAVEIAMAIDFIYDKIESQNLIPIKTQGNLWKWQGTKGTRKYHDEFEIIETMAKTYKHAEYRQALARSRYLFHPVQFIVISKDIVEEYEPFIKNVDKHELLEKHFLPIRRAGNKDDEIAWAIFDYLKTNDRVGAKDIERNYGINRKTVGEQIKRMLEVRTLRLAEGYKKKYVRNEVY